MLTVHLPVCFYTLVVSEWSKDLTATPHEKEPIYISITWGTENRSILYVLVPDHRRPEKSVRERNTRVLVPLVCEYLPELETGTEIKYKHCSQGGETGAGRPVNAQKRAEEPAWWDAGTDLRRAELKLAMFQLESGSSHNQDLGQDSAYTG